MADIFICYRKTDTGYAAGHLKDRLDEVFGPERVFLDHESLPAGADFDPELKRRLVSCTLMLLLIGERWLDMEQAPGIRKIDHEGDYVRQEIEIALDHHRTIVPVLLDGMRMSNLRPLPTEVEAIQGRQYIEIRERNSQLDISELTRRLLAEVPTRDFPRRQRIAGETGEATSETGAASSAKSSSSHDVQLGPRLSVVRLDNATGPFNGPISGHNSYG
ncbi:toll/interleukin-1 receptor domain-containing protein [Phytomonospora sp. NPDC050363]|uniref:toll/interleukin-1 receptor domain-containing protein n=1 Tax=Phytomonospora sp. NPDC050363 TaxID=3155642 RepID=UPI0033F4E8D4